MGEIGKGDWEIGEIGEIGRLGRLGRLGDWEIGGIGRLGDWGDGEMEMARFMGIDARRATLPVRFASAGELETRFLAGKRRDPRKMILLSMIPSRRLVGGCRYGSLDPSDLRLILFGASVRSGNQQTPQKHFEWGNCRRRQLFPKWKSFGRAREVRFAEGIAQSDAIVASERTLQHPFRWRGRGWRIAGNPERSCCP